MAHVSGLIATDIAAYLHAQEHKGLLRFITCGSVDDGKSTLIGRLLYDAHMVFEDQLTALEADSRTLGTQGGELDFALLVDGLGAEREQGITIDVAYRFFSTDKRKFIVADTPGHEQYTRNMVTGASTADVAVLLVDARQGVLPQTRRHSHIVSLLGIHSIAVAINKLDLVDYSQGVFDRVEADYRAFAASIGLTDVTCIPLSALRGDNMTGPSPNTPWYTGPTLMQYLETVQVDDVSEAGPFRMPVQWVNRPHLDFRGYSGRVIGGRVQVGDPVCIVPAGTTSRIARIITLDGDLAEAVAGQSVTLTLTDEVDCSRGDVLCAAASPARSTCQVSAQIIWMTGEELRPNWPYLLKFGTRTVGATVSPPRHRLDINTGRHVPAATLGLNEIGHADIYTQAPIAYDPYTESRDMGGFILIDRLTNNTVAAGLLEASLRLVEDSSRPATYLDKAARADLKGHGGCVVWFTGLAHPGSLMIADLLEARLHDLGVHTFLLRGDDLRHGLISDLDDSREADRTEAVRRVGEVARLMSDAGLVVLVPVVAHLRFEGAVARTAVQDQQFCEVRVEPPLSVAEDSAVPGTDTRRGSGTIRQFAAAGSSYDEEKHPAVRIDLTVSSPRAATEMIIIHLLDMGVIR